MDKKLVFLIVIFIAVFSVLLSYIFFQEPIRLRAKALQLPSASKSPIFSIKSVSVADGLDTCNITGFIRGDDGSVLPKKTVKLVTTNQSVKVFPNEAISDATGKVEFKITSNQTLETGIKMLVEGTIETTQESRCIFTEEPVKLLK